MKCKATNNRDLHEGKVAKLLKELDGINEANQNRVLKKKLDAAMKVTEVKYGWKCKEIVGDNPERFVFWYGKYGYKVQWGGVAGPSFPHDRSVAMLNLAFNKILEEGWKIDFRFFCDYCCNDTMSILVDTGGLLHSRI